ncbi:alpha amylase C-terminal domain-containing protein [Streptomyces sp. JH34]|uniref:alpha amylase C-terminal domain-containing protein n=1 Tax=Streptomyces sp. JH34 TaxID=2793633 RepID=UPI003211CCD3
MHHRFRLIGGTLAGVVTVAGLTTLAPWQSQATPPECTGIGDVDEFRHGGHLRTFTTSLPGGTYCNVAAASPDACDGNTVTVRDDGTVQAAVPARGALALHIGAREA